MRPEKPSRVDVNPRQQGLAGLGEVLSGFDTGSLPIAPSTPIPIQPQEPKRLGRVLLRRETAHRGGRIVIVVHGFPPTFTRADLEGLARDLRHAMGTGGTVRDRTIEIQGDQPAKIRAFLEKLGFQVAGAS